VFSSDHTKLDASLLNGTPVLARCTIAPK
jgi:hypothetical protein